ncbi:deoxyuridine 5'-triphosphate nucleotidohydrolase [Nautilia profundicola AmH]|uniref:Deoxyuridine 5'-triphosphate nucleotidohydrolase n=1 Tax=Nautilia profundicola (strain ATCC BAA-1463 / DSM 18972 / AmH) TaxID=598659 RepID=DUT_NAUPA|nr:dUTP diphosphatase [Nautilia profundicola]B9L823.1 RecName: Full=Deoxyuridine 5'-triphosphate nucleotidohydrolase; Short=dUTPase; AltName: Full=dUTP pyrophosphatase [Nautilia profundicola AmH]ACM92504.1 deoxyuridine 5'-triphosphate nucleotidohydrolase [Nautilia profundicola AmH]
MKLKIKKLNQEALIPAYQTKEAAGFDLHSIEDVIIKPGERKLIGTGLAFEIEFGYEVQIRPRSGLAFKHGITVLNTPGTIDSDYRGEIKVLLINHSNEAFEIKKEERIAQAVIAPVVQAEIIEVEELSDTERGAGGFGSTGK